GQPIQRALDEFLKSQGTFCTDNGNGGCQLYAGPVGNYLAWFDQGQGMTIAIDYAGLADTWLRQMGRFLGTQFNGTVTEQPLADGTVEVTVDFNGANVLSYAARGPMLGGDLAFGYRPPDLVDQRAQAALGNVHMRIVF